MLSHPALRRSLRVYPPSKHLTTNHRCTRPEKRPGAPSRSPGLWSPSGERGGCGTLLRGPATAAAWGRSSTFLIQPEAVVRREGDQLPEVYRALGCCSLLFLGSYSWGVHGRHCCRCGRCWKEYHRRRTTSYYRNVAENEQRVSIRNWKLWYVEGRRRLSYSMGGGEEQTTSWPADGRSVMEERVDCDYRYKVLVPSETPRRLGENSS
jgi:hypothetical protein